MRRLTTLIGICLMCMMPGTESTEAKPADGTYRVEVEEIVRHEEMAVVRFVVTFSGDHWVSIVGEDGHSAVRIEPTHGSGLAECAVILVVDRLDWLDEPVTKWFVNIRGGGQSGTWSPILPLAAPKALNDFLKVEIKPGQYHLGTEIVVAVSPVQTLRLRVGPKPS